MSIDFKKVQAQVREVLKSIGAIRDGHEAVAAQPPADPDSLDPRLDGAAPTDESMAAAGEEAAAGQGAEGGDDQDGGEGEGQDGDEPEAGASSEADGEDGDGRPLEKALGEDEFGNHDFSEEEIRRLEKAYGNGTGEAEPSELAKGGLDLEAVLEGILHAMEDQNVVIRALKDEISSLKAGQTATNRKLSKAISEMAPQPLVPAPPMPKAIAKAIPTPTGAAAPVLTPDEIFSRMKAGTLSPQEAMATARQAHSLQ